MLSHNARRRWPPNLGGYLSESPPCQPGFRQFEGSLEQASPLRGRFRNQDYQARKDQADERGHEEVDIVFHDVPPLLAGCCHPKESVEQASALLSRFLNEKPAEGQQQAKDEHQE